MKLKFKSQNFQTQAVNAAVDFVYLPRKAKSPLSVVDKRQISPLPEIGQGNALYIGQKTLTVNIHTVQKRNSPSLTPSAEDCQFCIEMETSASKIYVYTKTIFELNCKYGFTMFVIVVPSVAICVGVHKSFEIIREHFDLQYDNVPCWYFIHNDYFLV